MDRKKMLGSLVSNAVDFMSRAIEDIETRPKESVINFWNGVELFLKARLMCEHWALVVDKAGEADLKKFVAGDFMSVGMKDAIRRLESIAGETFGTAEKECINTLREHRNRLVHFFSPAYVGTPDKDVIRKVVAEQCRCWYYLSQRLKSSWRAHFADHAEAISKLDRGMHSLRVYLKVKYDSLSPQISKDEKSGTVFYDCESCGFHASREESVLGPKMESRCLVCDSWREYLKVECDDCGKTIFCRDGKGECDCGLTVDLGDLLEKFGARRSPKDEMIESSHAYCCECHEYEHQTVVPIDESWLCLNCLEEHSETGNCEWCSEHVTGDLEDSYLGGCMMCEGRSGWDDGD